MSVKFIATDLDGTLMAPDHLTVTARTVCALEQAHKRGVKLAVATGRPVSLTDYVIKQIPFADYIVCANGACVFDRAVNEIIYSNLIDNSIAKSIISYFLEKNIFFDVYVDGRSRYQESTIRYLSDTIFPEGFVEEVKNSMTGYENLLEYLGNAGIEKITLYSLTDDESAEYTDYLRDLGLEVSVSFEHGLEAAASGVNKAAAVQSICEKLKITAAEVMAFGDEGNDVPLMKFAGYSFAMGNASDFCKANAKYIAKSNAEDGVADAVEKFVLNNG